MNRADRRARKKQRRHVGVTMVRCDRCGRVQPLTHGAQMRPTRCSCGHIYGTYHLEESA